MSIENFISDNSIPIILVLSACAAAVILILFFLLRNSMRVQKLMYKDTEFNVWNLNYLRYRAMRKLAVDRSGNYAVAYTDIGQFKSYNALYGWSAGQKVLELVIEVLSKEVDSKRELYARSYLRQPFCALYKIRESGRSEEAPSGYSRADFRAYL